ncbi:RNA polymerase sigma factor [Chitinophaga sp. XS-30]|uniref:RNA polymerase sigma factor n=1 Tax=Chitinophaga sp. XS-30 TaxID=2604421 RepID=UPI00143CD29F|nr:sigma-70 family RNA polymerase sigma factor [Chitinophaga sp. XS-30]
MNPKYIHTSGHAAHPDQHHALADLIEGCRRQDRLCQEKLYMLYFDRMLGIIRRYTSDQDAAISILNNGFLRAFRKIAQFGHKGSFEGWLRQIIIHAAADYFREHKAGFSSDLPEQAPAPQASPMEYKELLQVLERLPSATRVVINLFIIEGYTHREIAAMLGISTGTSKWHVAEGRRLLKDMLHIQSSSLK